MTVEAAPFIPYADPAAMPPRLGEALAAYEARMGFLPNALRLYMHRPEILELLIALNNTVMRAPSSTLDAGLKRRLAAVCSAVNESAYCVAHNSNTLKTRAGGAGEGWGFSDEELAELLDPGYRPADEAEAACFAFARAASRDPGEVPADLRARLARLLTPAQVVELACVVGFWKMYNSIHEALDVPIEAALLAD